MQSTYDYCESYLLLPRCQTSWKTIGLKFSSLLGGGGQERTRREAEKNDR